MNDTSLGTLALFLSRTLQDAQNSLECPSKCLPKDCFDARSFLLLSHLTQVGLSLLHCNRYISYPVLDNLSFIQMHRVSLSSLLLKSVNGQNRAFLSNLQKRTYVNRMKTTVLGSGLLELLKQRRGRSTRWNVS